MKIGSLMLNFWAALVSFTIYFLIMFQKQESPITILIGSFIFATLGFLIMFLIRYLIGYILYTPDENELINELEENEKPEQIDNLQPLQNQSSTSKVNNESSEEIAQVVRTMMNS